VLPDGTETCTECGFVLVKRDANTRAGKGRKPPAPDPLSPDTRDANPGEGPQADDLQPGSLLWNRFRIKATLGRGGMGVVYKAKDEALGVTVAVKVLSTELTSDPVAIERLKQEVLTARELQHPNIVRVTQYYPGEGQAGFDMEYLEGSTLAAHLADRVEGSPFTPPATAERLPALADILDQLAAALDHIHGEGLVHRDVKPSNVMLVPKAGGGFAVKLLDFGIVQVGDGSGLTGQITPGTLEYMARELLSGRGKPSPRSDIYSLGKVVYYALTGEPAEYGHDSDHPSDLVENLPSSVDAPVLACMGRLDRRPECAERLASVIREAADDYVTVVEAERLARIDAERKAREETERKAREEAARVAREAERKERQEAERNAQEEVERKARVEAERLAREEAERQVKLKAERKAKDEAERRPAQELDKRAIENAGVRAREETTEDKHPNAGRPTPNPQAGIQKVRTDGVPRYRNEPRASTDDEEIEWRGESVLMKFLRTNRVAGTIIGAALVAGVMIALVIFIGSGMLDALQGGTRATRERARDSEAANAQGSFDPLASLVIEEGTLRAEPTEGSHVITTLSKGDIVQLLNKHGAWYEVRTSTSGRGFVLVDKLRPGHSVPDDTRERWNPIYDPDDYLSADLGQWLVVMDEYLPDDVEHLSVMSLNIGNHSPYDMERIVLHVRFWDPVDEVSSTEIVIDEVVPSNGSLYQELEFEVSIEDAPRATVDVVGAQVVDPPIR